MVGGTVIIAGHVRSAEAARVSRADLPGWTWVSTSPGKISGSALDSRASARRFLSSRQEDVIGDVASVGAN
jgi:hypothetical protein